MNDKTFLMFHEVIDNPNFRSGWHLETNGKYTVSCNFFIEIVKKYNSNVNYSFDDGGLSNLFVSKILKSNNIKGYFFISTGFIGKKGFLNLDQIRQISKYHFVISHGHKHIMKTTNFSELYFDWNSSLNFMKKNNFNHTQACLPGGFFTKNHYEIFSKLNVKYIFHSAPYNLILNFLYGDKFIFIPRIIVTSKFNSLKKFNYTGIKSMIKQLVDYFK